MKFVSLCQTYVETERGTQLKIRNTMFRNFPSQLTFSRQHRIWSFGHVAENGKEIYQVVQRFITHEHSHCPCAGKLFLKAIL